MTVFTDVDGNVIAFNRVNNGRGGHDGLGREGRESQARCCFHYGDLERSKTE